MRYLAVAFIFLTSLASWASGAVFQYSYPVAAEKSPFPFPLHLRVKVCQYILHASIRGKTSTAFLWIPAEANQVRGVVMAGMTLMEREFVKDPLIRKACADQQIAIVFLKCGLGAVDIQKVLDDGAKVSGYRELSVAPLMFVGHSAGGPQAHDAAVKYGPRCFGLMQYRGGGPFDGPAIPSGIPTLMMVGQFDEFGGRMRDREGLESWQRSSIPKMAGYRAADEARVSSIIVEPGAGHFPWSDRNAVYLAMWIRKAAAARIPASWLIDAVEPVALVDLDPKTGWLSDLTIKGKVEYAPAAYADFKGDKGKANWHFDKEMADATTAYHTGFDRKDQFIKWTDAFNLDAGVRCFFNSIKWVGDGQTFEVHPVYADKYPTTQPGGEWTSANGNPAGHSTAPILVKLASGPLAVAGPNTFRIHYDNLSPATESARPTFLAYSAGDAEYRYTEQVGMLPRNFSGLKDGKAQTITFAPIGNLKLHSPPIELKATSDSGLPVEYYVATGPATIEGGKLKVAEVPARATFPITVKVAAYQFGSGVAPLVKTATPVEQTVELTNP